MSTLREQMLEDLQLKGLTPKTQKIYLREVSNFAKYFDKSPEQHGEKELREYLLYLLNKRKLSKGTYRFYYQCLKFLYKHTLKREEVVEKIHCPRRKRSFRWFWTCLKSRLNPLVLSKQKVMYNLLFRSVSEYECHAQYKNHISIPMRKKNSFSPYLPIV